MRDLKTIGLAALLAGLAGSGLALAEKPLPERGTEHQMGAPPPDRSFPRRDRHLHHARSHVGVYLGVPLWPYYYHDPFYDPFYYRREIIRVPPPAPTVYIEKGDSGSAASESEYWYYCPSSKTYYPYVTDCKEDWLKVVPSTPDSL